MNVLVNCLSLRSGGAVAYLTNLLPRLALIFDRNSAHKLRVLAHRDQMSFHRDVEEDHFILLTENVPTGYRRLIWEWVNMSNIARDNKTDVIYHPYQIGSLPRGPKSVLMLSNMEPFRFQSYSYTKANWARNILLGQYSRKCLKAADRIIAISDFTQDVLVNEVQIDRSRIIRIYNGKNDDFHPSTDASADKYIIDLLGIKSDFILTPGSLLPYRRTEDVIRAFASMRAHDHKPIELIITGAMLDTYYFNKLVTLVGEQRITEKVKFLGHVSIDAMQALYRLCRMCIIASEVEACPTIAIEAMASGCVIISSDREPMPEMLDGCGILYTARDTVKLTEYMNKCLGDVAFISELKQRALDRSEYFSWDRCADETYRALTTF